jgi:1-acyl-sn-glycerol-3-phosphate acyltransferase
MQSSIAESLTPPPGRLKGRVSGGRSTELGHFNLADGWRPSDAKLRRPSARALVRAVVRILLIMLWTLVSIPIQTVLVLLPGGPPNHPKVTFARIYWSTISRLLGLRIRVIGTPATQQGRPVVFVSNHSSWLDIPVIGGRLRAVFVSKDDVARWPIVGTIARLGRTIFVSRHRQSTARERDDMRARLDRGDNMVLFPEGTSSDGSRVLPFRSAFFAAVVPDKGDARHPPLVQPVSLVFDRLGGLPMGRANRPLFAWYGDMALTPHFWRLIQQTGCRATLLLHPPVDPAMFASRKEVAQATWQAVADGAALLRQNRPTRAEHATISRAEHATVSRAEHATVS